ncbi:MAG TPA: type II toxin-antitoxin system VapC family toxin, partial [Blastocatellia bacterium]
DSNNHGAVEYPRSLAANSQRCLPQFPPWQGSWLRPHLHFYRLTAGFRVNGILFDTNVLLDIATADVAWLAWSETQFRAAVAQGPILINPIVYAELAPAFATQEDMDNWLDAAVFERLPLPYAAGWIAAQAFLKYRRVGGTKASPLPDFYIGAHAAVEGLTLVTRDAARYRTYFPNVGLITP